MRERFQKLHRRIYRSILLPAVFFLAVTGMISLAVIADSLYRTTQNIALEIVDRSVGDSRFYLQSVRNSAENLAKNRTILAAASEGPQQGITELLNKLCSYSVTMNGATLYSLETGDFYTSSRMMGPPTLDMLLADERVSAFLEGPEEGMISVRTDNVSKIYNDTLYPPEYGIVSYLRKVTEEGKLLGLLVADLHPEILYQKYMNYSALRNFGSMNSRIFAGGACLERPGQSFPEGYGEGEAGVYAELSRIVIRTPFLGDSLLVTVLPLGNFYGRLAVVGSVLLLLSALLGLGVRFLARRIASGVTAPLESLRERMISEH